MEYNYCPFCAKPLIKDKDSLPACCTGHFIQYPSQIVGVAGILIKDGKGLLEQRAIHPGYGKWALPGGMAEIGETPEEVLTREFFEETGIHVEAKKLVDVKGGSKILIVFYEAAYLGGNLKVSEESLQVKWFDLNEIPWKELAFPRHKALLEEWCRND
jgi:ADP-ribose pyrophosphatase YjhB (NUDIX family)